MNRFRQATWTLQRADRIARRLWPGLMLPPLHFNLRWLRQWSALGFLCAACLGRQPVPKLSPTRTAASETLAISPFDVSAVIGDTIRFRVTAQPRTCAPVWQSLNPEVATISADGLLTVRRAGSTTVRAICGSSIAGTTVHAGKR